jgi:uncharacterized protein YbbC (DUF1343 family)
VVCGGIEIHITDRENFESVKTALHVMKAFQAAIKDGSMRFSTSLDKMFGVQGFYINIQSRSVDEILQNCEQERSFYIELAKKAWLYDVKENAKIATE